MSKARNFDVIATMCDRNLNVHGYYADNIKRINAGSKGWGDVTIAISTADAQALMTDQPRYVMLLVIDAEQFGAVKAELEGRGEKQGEDNG